MHEKLCPTDNVTRTRIPKLGWIFFRKYSADSYRNLLVSHCDANLFTANIALNANYKGVGLFCVKPPVAINYDQVATSEIDENFEKDVLLCNLIIRKQIKSKQKALLTKILLKN